MKRIFSTDDVRPTEGFGWWQDWMRRNFVANDSVPDSPADFSLNLSAAELDELSLVSIETGSVTCTHARHHIESTADELMLIRQMKGQVSLQHNGHAITLAPGNMTLIDPRLVYTCRYGADSALLVVKYPRRSLAARIGNIGTFAGNKLNADAGVSGLLSEFLRVLPAHADRLDGAAIHASTQVLDLLAMALLKASAGTTPRIGSSRSILAHRLRAAIDKALADPTATAQSIAASAGISLRYANSILNEYDTSVSRLLQSQRLERCRQALADPLSRQRSISSIAYAWGFSDLTHFARRFRRAFGVVPSEYRKQLVYEPR